MNTIIGKHNYSRTDQLNFSKLSKDFNPIHCDGIESRKLLFGKEIVHGVNLLLTSLNYFFKTHKVNKPQKITCNFYKPVFLNQKIIFVVKRKIPGLFIINLESKNIIFSQFILYYRESNKQTDFIELKYKKKINKTKIKIDKKIFDNQCVINKRNKFFEVNLNNIKYKNEFKYINHIFNKLEVKEILSISYFIGMICPGKNSIISKVDINFPVQKNTLKKRIKNIDFILSKFNKNFRQIDIDFEGQIRGSVVAFKYSQPLKKSLNILKKIFKKNNILKNKTALIIGGSRGLGAITSKYLSLCECKTYVSYSLGKEEANKTKKEINNFKKKMCRIINLDINKNFNSILKKIKNIEFLFYFATPKILASDESKFDKKLYKYYKTYYYTKFKEICSYYNKNSKKKN